MLQYQKDYKSPLQNKPLRKYPYSDVVRLAWSRVTENYAGGSVATGRPSQTGQIKGIFSPSILGVGFGADDSSTKKNHTTSNRKSSPTQGLKKKKEKK